MSDVAIESDDLPVDAKALREEIKSKYREVAVEPNKTYHFHTGRPLAARLGYDGEVVDAGSGAGFDSFVAATKVGPEGRVVGIDMTEEMLAKSRSTARALGFDHVEFREGLLEDMPVEDGWADTVISNGVINLCADKRRVMGEIMRVLRPGGYFQFADIANGKPVPDAAIANIDLWTA
jgi:arsenite methyltransferase